MVLPLANPAMGQTVGYGPGIVEIARVYNLDPALIAAIISVESNFNPSAVSRKGARGLMQLMPATADELGVAKMDDPWENIEGGARYFREKLDRFAGDIRLALAAYNAGEAPVRQHGGIPPYPETVGFVNEVLARYEALKSRGLPHADSHSSSPGPRDPSPTPEARPPQSERAPEGKPPIVLEVEEVGPPARAVGHLREGARLEREGRVADAIAHYREALALAPSFPEAHNQLGLAYLALGRLEEAQSEFEKARGLAPQTARFLNNLGLVLHMRGEFRRALTILRTAWEREPARVESGVNLALILKRLGRRDEAGAVLTRVLRIRERLPEGHLNLASLLEEVGDRAGAVLHYRRFLELTEGQSSALRDQVRERVRALGRP
ncbi:MAG: transglycosylase SLT domain-containing protein [Candidatus Rokubacteria bacterium]|nr:transglycosylase SLT domain-containing protein [Candidatus Rokubacteria bacterium]